MRESGILCAWGTVVGIAGIPCFWVFSGYFVMSSPVLVFGLVLDALTLGSWADYKC